MDPTKTLIKYTLKMLRENRLTELRHRLRVCLELLETLPVYTYDNVVNTVCEVEEEANATDV